MVRQSRFHSAYCESYESVVGMDMASSDSWVAQISSGRPRLRTALVRLDSIEYSLGQDPLERVASHRSFAQQLKQRALRFQPGYLQPRSHLPR
jgi:hypothetical protein